MRYPARLAGRSGDIRMWRTLGSAAAGRMHVDIGKGCEDSFGWLTNDEQTVLVVADGAGSRPRSAAGSIGAVEAILDCAGLCSTLSIDEALMSALGALQALADCETRPVDDFATTLSVIILRPTGATIGQIGDCIVVAQFADGTIASVSPPEKYEYANETMFLTSPGGIDSTRRADFAAGEIVAVAASTDGLRFKILSDLAIGTAYEPFFVDLFAFASSPESTGGAIERLLDSLEDQSGDDKTLIVAVPGQPVVARFSGPLRIVTTEPDPSSEFGWPTAIP